MKHVSLICLILLLSFFSALGQGTVRGKITDENGESIIGAAIVLKSKPTVGIVTDLDGNYSLKITDSFGADINHFNNWLSENRRNNSSCQWPGVDPKLCFKT
ncbi:MAG: carboxypeptidase-like regulatory domain-containing protein [Bacteroidetes bacterium]|nr:carboxypeptidase-like regulatory domain-containing protein [Bacteroidota bacterium]